MPCVNTSSSFTRTQCIKPCLSPIAWHDQNFLAPPFLGAIKMASATQAPIFLDNYQAVVSTLSDFLTVAVHTILYERDIYPRTSFLSARKYNYPVRQNRHPKVCKWITDAVAAVEKELLKASISFSGINGGTFYFGLCLSSHMTELPLLILRGQGSNKMALFYAPLTKRTLSHVLFVLCRCH